MLTIGDLTVLAVLLLVSVLFVYSRTIFTQRVGFEILRRGYPLDLSTHNGVADRNTRWALRKGRALKILLKSSNSLIVALRMTDFVSHSGFLIGINVTRLGFLVSGHIFHSLDICLAVLYSFFPCEPVRRMLRFFHFVDEVGVFAEVISIFALRFTMLLVRLGLRVAIVLLQTWSSQALLDCIKSICFSSETRQAVGEVIQILCTESTPLIKLIPIEEIISSIRLLSKICDEDGNMTIEATWREWNNDRVSVSEFGNVKFCYLDELDFAADLRKHSMFAVGMYGHVGLKFLGIVPYGSVTSDIQAFAYCAGIKDTSVVLSSWFGSGLYSPAYALCIDHTSKSLIFCIRGSLFPLDFVSDFVCEPIEVELLQTKGYSHKGMYLAAERLEKLLRQQLLQGIESHPDYAVSICGHSYGAGVAVLLAAIWLSRKETRKIKEKLKVYGFGTPAVLSPEIAAKLTQIVVTTVMGNDMVPRFSLNSFRRFRERVVNGGRATKTTDEKPLGRILYSDVKGKEILLSPGTIVWAQETGNRHEMQVVLCEDGSLSRNKFGDLVVSRDMFLSHLPQCYSVLGNVPLPAFFW